MATLMSIVQRAAQGGRQSHRRVENYLHVLDGQELLHRLVIDLRMKFQGRKLCRA